MSVALEVLETTGPSVLSQRSQTLAVRGRKSSLLDSLLRGREYTSCLLLLLFSIAYLADCGDRISVLLTVFGYTCFVLLFKKELSEYMFLVRTAFLGAPGLLAFLFVYVLKGYISIWFPEYQTDAYTLQIQFLTILSLLAHGIGWRFGMRQPLRRSVSHFRFVFYNSERLLFLLLACAMTMGYLSAGRKEPIWIVAYGAKPAKQVLSIGVYPIWAVACLIWAYVVYKSEVTRRKPLWGFLFYLVVLWVVGYQFLAKGRRLEVLAFFISFVGVKATVEHRRVSHRKVAVFAIFALITLSFVGSIRSSLAHGLVPRKVLSSRMLYRKDSSGRFLSSISTVGPITATLYRAVAELDNGMGSYLHGTTYLQYIPRTLPKVLYPNRPEAIVWQYSAQGGILEQAEAYRNFGLIGCIVVPLTISFLLARFGARNVCVDRGILSSFHVAVYGLLLAVLPRGIWYQTFAMYKSVVVVFLLWGGIFLLQEITSPVPWRNS